MGENSLGALTFGQVSSHQLPNSKLKAFEPENNRGPILFERSPELLPLLTVLAVFVLAAVRIGQLVVRREAGEDLGA